LPLNALVGVLGVAIGGATLGFFHGFVTSGPLPNEFMAYPVGLLIGIWFYPLTGMWDSVARDVTNEKGGEK
jgi:phosphotransferase system  glucose/maltose/N-acetylglucosamine-specific IIC component